MYNVQRSSVSRYRDALVAGVDTRTEPHRTVALLLAGAIERVRLADSAIVRSDTPKKIQALNSAINIIDTLRSSLDHQGGGQIAAGLESLYEYMGLRLMEANLSNDRARIREVTALLGEIASAWGAIPPQTVMTEAH